MMENQMLLLMHKLLIETGRSYGVIFQSSPSFWNGGVSPTFYKLAFIVVVMKNLVI